MIELRETQVDIPITGKEVEDYIDMAGGVTGNSTSKYYIIQSGTGDRIFIRILRV